MTGRLARVRDRCADGCRSSTCAKAGRAAIHRAPPNSYVSGPISLFVSYDGEGGSGAIEDVTFFADGQQICAAASRLQCDWDFRPRRRSARLRAVARLKGGGRVVANLRTKAIEFAQTEFVDIVQANVVVKAGRSLCQGLTRESFRLLDDKQQRPITDLIAGGPLQLMLALDVSSSMTDALPDVRRAARGFLKAIGDGIR
jgi:hypothetical protein